MRKIYNPQCWSYNGLKLEEVNFFRFAIIKYRDKDITSSRIINSYKLITEYIDKYKPYSNEKLYYSYLNKWCDHGILEYGTSINNWWFDLMPKNNYTLNNSGYFKIISSLDKLNYEIRKRLFLQSIGLVVNPETHPYNQYDKWYYNMREPKMKENKNE